MLYTNKSINIISFIITIIIFSIFNFCDFNIKQNPAEKVYDIISTIHNEKKEKEELEDQPTNLGNWYIQIPSINLTAPIAEGTDLDILNTKVGHFKDTSLKNGNIGLAAHNRGYENNYFKNLKKVKMEDEIIYTYEEYKKTYIIDTIEIIPNTNWEYLKNTDENKITLITCVENEPQYRRCVQATELEN